MKHNQTNHTAGRHAGRIMPPSHATRRMRKGRYGPPLLLFTAMICISLFVICLTYSIISDKLFVDVIVRHFVINLPFCLVLGAADIWIVSSISRKGLFRNNAARVSADLLLTTAASILFVVIVNYIVAAGSRTATDIAINSLTIIPLNWIIILQIEIFVYQQRQNETERRLETIEKERALYQFEMLKNQINPHFLFNSLNILASLAWQDAEKTNRFAKKLSQVYRYLLATHGCPKVTLGEELCFLDSYLYLEKIRFGDTLHVVINGSEGRQNSEVIPASIQMLVENALKHNINTVGSPLTITIDIDTEGITVTNNLQPRSHTGTNGTGLENLRRQYALYNKVIEIKKDEREFRVHLPFVG